MTSPVPKHLRTFRELLDIPLALRDHISDLKVVEPEVSVSSETRHPAKYAPGLPTALIDYAGSINVGDPMAGTGRLAEETGLPVLLNEPDPRWWPNLERLRRKLGCRVTHGDARRLRRGWDVHTAIFSPPYYPRTDRRVAAAHNPRRGPVVGYRTGYGAEGVPGFIGDPCGSDGILLYRNAMREVYGELVRHARRLIVVVKNQTRLGVELRLDLDTILTAQEAGWRCCARTGWEPRPSLWARYNLRRGTGVTIEDVLVFE